MWGFIISCMRGALPLGECRPVYELTAIIIMLGVAVFGLAWLVHSRRLEARDLQRPRASSVSATPGGPP